MYNEGFVSSDGATQDRDLAGDAVWLAGVVATSLPREAEAWGLAALLTFQHARAAARFDDARRRWCCCPTRTGRRWDHAAIAAGEAMLERAAALHAPGPLQLQAAIAACHATSAVVGGDRLAADRHPLRRARAATTPPRWSGSTGRRPRPARARARRRARWPSVDALADRLDGYHLFHATRAELLTALGRDDEADAANTRALELTTNDAERRLLTTRLHRHPLSDGS